MSEEGAVLISTNTSEEDMIERTRDSKLSGVGLIATNDVEVTAEEDRIERTRDLILSFVQSPYQRCLHLGQQLSIAQKSIAHVLALEHSLVHNFSRQNSGCKAYYYIWKPSMEELKILEQVKDASRSEKQSESLELTSRSDRFVAHYIAEMLELRHETVQTEGIKAVEISKGSSRTCLAAAIIPSPTPLTRTTTWDPTAAELPLFASVDVALKSLAPASTSEQPLGPVPIVRVDSVRVINGAAMLEQSLGLSQRTHRRLPGAHTGEVYVLEEENSDQRSIFKLASSSAARVGYFPSYVKEIAAFRLDHRGFSGVLPTIEKVVELKGLQQSGMMQLFKAHDQTADEDEFGRSFIKKLSVRDVHKVGLLDVRLFNQDRHGGNLLIDVASPDSMRLVPIDHELTLPPCDLLSGATFCWLDWPQAAIPFDDDTLTYIDEGLNMHVDVSILQELRIPSPSVATMKICLTLLKIGASNGLTLRDIGSIMVEARASCAVPLCGPLSAIDHDAGLDASALFRLVSMAQNKAECFGDEEHARFELLVAEFAAAFASKKRTEAGHATLLDGGPLQRLSTKR